MSLTNFLQKERRVLTEDGLISAVKEASIEIPKAGLTHVVDRVSTPIWESDADVVLVLDACRADLWHEVVGSDNSLVCSMAEYGDMWPLASNSTTKVSVGGMSSEWMSKTFHGKYSQHWKDAAYITANPFTAKQGHETESLDEDVFPLANRGLAYIDEVWKDAWTEQPVPTVDPETLTDRAFYAYKTVAADTYIVHYMQPHVPFRSRPEWTDGWDVEAFGTGGGRGKAEFHQLRDGELSRGEFWTAYAKNLEWVLKEVHRWYRRTDAKILVTSDHGNAMGEWGDWGHLSRTANPAIRKVPWCEVSGCGVAPIESVSSPPSKQVCDGITDQLAALGYR